MHAAVTEPAQIVDKARDKNTELHKLFEWNDGIAAEKYREVQARNVIRMLVVKQEPCDEVPEPHMVRVIVSRNEGNCQYQPVQVTVRSEDSYQKLLTQAICGLEAFKRKYQALAELEFIIEELEKLIS